MGQGSKEFTTIERSHEQEPISVPYVQITGSQPGPTLTVMAGAHGSEYVGITAAMSLAQTIDPDDIRGQLRIITVANVPGFYGRSMHICPVDGLNMAGRFPGDDDGSFSDALAALIFDRVAKGSDMILDLHGGDLEERLIAYSSWVKTGNKQVDEISEKMAYVVDFPNILHEQAADPFIRGSLYRAGAVKLGIPGVLLEAGKHGELQPDLVDLQFNGILNVMMEMKMIDGVPSKQYVPVHMKRFVSVNSPRAGAFYPEVDEGELIAEGAVLGTLTDLYGAEMEIVKSPVNAVVLGIITTTAMPEGAMVAGLGELME